MSSIVFAFAMSLARLPAFFGVYFGSFDVLAFLKISSLGATPVDVFGVLR
jgi:hypothetical protein